MKKKIIVGIMLIMTSLTLFADEQKILRIGIVYDSVSKTNIETGKIFAREAEKILGKSKVVITEEAADNKQYEGIKKIIEEMDKKDDVDVIISVGIIGSYIADNIEVHDKFIIAPFYYGEKKESNNSKKISFTSEKRVENDLEQFYKLAKINKAVIVTSDIAEKIYRKRIEELKKYQGIRVLNGENDLGNITEKVTSGEGIVLGLLYEPSDEDMSKLSEKMIKKGIPSFSIMGSCDTDRGVLAGFSYEKEVEKRARKAAIVLQKIYDEEKLNRYEEVKQGEEQLVINMETADKLKITLPWKVAESSKTVFEGKSFKTITLKEILEQSIKNNNEIKIKEKEIEVQKNEVEKSGSNYLPKLSADISGVLIDKKSTDASMGTYKERTVKGELKATQLIYSEDANVNSDIQKKTQEIKELEKKMKTLDTIATEAVTYLQLLKAEAAVKINKETLDINQTNLEISKNKVKNGAINNADMFRWESETAISKTNVARAEGISKQVKKSILRNAGMDIDEEFSVENEEEIIKFIGGNIWKIAEAIENEKQEKIIREFFTNKAKENSIELKLLGKELDLRTRYGEYAERKMYMPTIAMQAGYSYKPYAEGGSDGIDLSGLRALGIPMKEIEKAPKDNWSIGIGVSFDIYSGGEKQSEKNKAKNEIEKTILKKEDAEKAIEEEIQREYINLETEYYNMKNLENAKNALQSNYELVNSSYKTGQIEISALLSSRNALVSVEQGLIVAKYDFLTALVKIERIMGVMLFSDKEKQDKWEKELVEKLELGK